jgi:hypothetical protein
MPALAETLSCIMIAMTKNTTGHDEGYEKKKG